MATKKQVSEEKPTIPKNLDKHIFYGLQLDAKQKEFRDAIWDPQNICVMVNAKAGTGKTTIAVAMGLLMCKYGLFEDVVYIFSPCREKDIGYRPGSTEEKMQSYTESLYNALIEIGEQPEKVIASIANTKMGNPSIQAVPHTFLRGVNLKNKFVIIDEAQNYPFDELKKTLTRIHDNSKVVCIGHSGQIDIPTFGRCAFEKYMEYGKTEDFVKICDLTVNYRGKFSQWADDIAFNGKI